MSQPPTSRPGQQPYRQKCVRCHATGRMACEICSGRGEVTVGRDRLGHPKTARCSGCFGLKTMRCRHCGGEGYLQGV